MLAQSTSLEQLHDIVEPETIGWWPLAPGLLIVLVLLLLFAIGSLFVALRKWRRNGYRRSAIRSLLEATSEYEVMKILRRTALVVGEREQVSQMTGLAWIHWLRESGDLPPDPQFDQQLMLAAYCRTDEPALEFEAVRQFAMQWVRCHRLTK